MPQERTPEVITCSHDGCKSHFFRPQDASGDLDLVDIAQLHGWTLIDREKGLAHCAWGHDKE